MHSRLLLSSVAHLPAGCSRRCASSRATALPGLGSSRCPGTLRPSPRSAGHTPGTRRRFACTASQPAARPGGRPQTLQGGTRRSRWDPSGASVQGHWCHGQGGPQSVLEECSRGTGMEIVCAGTSRKGPGPNTAARITSACQSLGCAGSASQPTAAHPQGLLLFPTTYSRLGSWAKAHRTRPGHQCPSQGTKAAACNPSTVEGGGRSSVLEPSQGAEPEGPGFRPAVGGKESAFLKQQPCDSQRIHSRCPERSSLRCQQQGASSYALWAETKPSPGRAKGSCAGLSLVCKQGGWGKRCLGSGTKVIAKNNGSAHWVRMAMAHQEALAGEPLPARPGCPPAKDSGPSGLATSARTWPVLFREDGLASCTT